MSSLNRTVRFKADEAKDIDRFLAQNPFFDFSSLARVAIQKFIESPQLLIKAVKPDATLTKIVRSASKPSESRSQNHG